MWNAVDSDQTQPGRQAGRWAYPASVAVKVTVMDFCAVAAGKLQSRGSTGEGRLSKYNTAGRAGQ